MDSITLTSLSYPEMTKAHILGFNHARYPRELHFGGCVISGRISGDGPRSNSRRCKAAAALLEQAQRAGVVRADVQGSDVIRLAHGVSMVADAEDPGQADRMLALLFDGLLTPAGRPAD